MILRSLSHRGQLRGVKTFEQSEDVSIFLVLLKYYIFFHLVLPFRSYKRHVFQKTNKVKFTLIFKYKKFSRPVLTAWFFLLEHQWVFESSAIVANEFLSCPRCEKMDLKIKTRDSWTTITKQKNTAVDHSGNNTVSSVCKLLNRVIFINSTIIFSCGLHVNILCEISYSGQY